MELTPSTFGGGMDGSREAWGLELSDGNDLCLDGADLYDLAVVRPTVVAGHQRGLRMAGEDGYICENYPQALRQNLLCR